MPFVAGNQQPIQYPPPAPPNQPFVGPLPDAVGPWNPNGPGYPGTQPPPFVGPMPNQVGPYNPYGPGFGQASNSGRGGSPYGGPIQSPWGGRGGDRQGFMDRSQMHSAYSGPMGIGGFQRGPQMPQRPRGMGPMGIDQGGGGSWWRPTANTGSAAWAQGQQQPSYREQATMGMQQPEQMYNRPAYGGPAPQDSYLK